MTMYCNKCGSQLADGSVYCNQCGSKVGAEDMNTVQNTNVPPVQGAQQPYYSQNTQQNFIPQDMRQPAYQQNLPPESRAEAAGLSIASMIMGIVGILLFCFPVLSLACGFLGIIFALCGFASKRPGRGMAVAGLSTGIVAVVFELLMLTSVITPFTGMPTTWY